MMAAATTDKKKNGMANEATKSKEQKSNVTQLQTSTKKDVENLIKEATKELNKNTKADATAPKLPEQKGAETAVKLGKSTSGYGEELKVSQPPVVPQIPVETPKEPAAVKSGTPEKGKVIDLHAQNAICTLEGDKLTIVVDISRMYGLSASGKSHSVATTWGNKDIGDTGLKIGLNIYKPTAKSRAWN